MVAIFNKDLLTGYLIALKQREVEEFGNQGSSTEQEPLQKQQNQEAAPKEAVQEVIKQDKENGKDLGEAGKGKSLAAEWIISIREKLDQAHQDDAKGSWGKISIYRIPLYLRKDDKAYVPQTVSIGPYHHGMNRLSPMDKHKWRSLHHVLKRTGQDIEVYLYEMKDMEQRVRSCYEGSFDLHSDEFVEMLLDGCFVLELFQGAAYGFEELGYDRNDPVFAIRSSMHSIQRDMIMLENQLPLIVLDRLLEIQYNDPADQKMKVDQLALKFFESSMPLMPGDFSLTYHTPVYGQEHGLHCLDVLRRSLLSGASKILKNKFLPINHSSAEKPRVQLIHCVTELKVAGIKFKKRETDQFWDIEFKNGVLWIPPLLIHDGTKTLFLNLIAFEQCHLECRNDITSYVIFMDNLINSQEDVSYLHYCRIIEPMLSNNGEVADLFNRICQEVVFDIDNSYLGELYEQINRYHKQRWNTWRTILKHRYFNNPWAIISLVAAVILLLPTFGQTFYALYGYYQPP